jgi:hypothetical protein
MQNLGTLRRLSLGDLADDGRREERETEKEIMHSLMATSLHWRTHSARTNYILYLWKLGGLGRTNLRSTYVILCHIMSSYVILWQLMSSYVILCHLMSSYVILCHLMLSHVISCHLMSS